MTQHAIAETVDSRTLEDVIAGVDAGHRLAEHEPDDIDHELGRRQLRGEISADEAVAATIDKVRRDHDLA